MTSARRSAEVWRRLPALLLVAILWSCVEPAETPKSPDPDRQAPEAGPVSGGTLVVGVGADLSGVNPLVGSGDTFSQSIIDQMFLHLFEEQDDYAERPPSLAPGLARSWRWSEDRLELALELRDDVVWSDGVPVTAEDVAWTWRAQRDPEVAWGLAQMKDSISDLEVLGPHTLRVVWSRVYPGQLTDLNEGAILPRHAWSRLPAGEWRANSRWFVDNLVVNGPFTLEAWRPQREIVLARNTSYHEPGLPYLDRVVFRVVPETSNQIRQLLAGDLDFVGHVPAADAAKIEASPDHLLAGYWRRQYNYLCWNLGNPLFAEAEVRRALTGAIDRQSLVDTLWLGHARVASSPIISSVWAHDPGLEPWPFDPARSRRALEGLGWRDEDGDGFLERAGERFSFELLTNADSAVRVDAAVMLQEQLRQVGLEVEVRSLEFNTVIRRALDHRFDAILGAWTIDSSLDLTYAFHGDSIEDGYNFGRYANPELDRLIDAARFENDLDRRRALLFRAQAILHDDQPYTFLWESRRLVGMSRRVRNAQANASSTYFRLREWWLLPR